MDKKKAILLVGLLFLGGSLMAFNKKTNKTTSTTNQDNGFAPTPNPPNTDFSKKIQDAITEAENTPPSADPNSPPPNPVVVVISLEEITKQLYQEMRKRNSRPKNIMALLREVSQEDFALMVNMFGKKSYDKLFRTDLTDSVNGSFEDTDLKGWLSVELPLADYQTLKEKYPNYL